MKKYYLDSIIRMCSKCNRIDVKTYATYKKIGNSYVIDKKYSECQECGNIEEIRE